MTTRPKYSEQSEQVEDAATPRSAAVPFEEISAEEAVRMGAFVESALGLEDLLEEPEDA